MLYILTGPPSSGVSNFSKDFSKIWKRCVRIDVEPYKWLINTFDQMPWESERGRKYHLREIRKACFLAKHFLEDGHGHLVLIHELLTMESAEMYRKDLESFYPKIIQFLPSYEEVIAREKGRGQVLTHAEISKHYHQQKEFYGFDVRIDATNLSALEIFYQISTSPTIDISQKQDVRN